MVLQYSVGLSPDAFAMMLPLQFSKGSRRVRPKASWSLPVRFRQRLPPDHRFVHRNSLFPDFQIRISACLAPCSTRGSYSLLSSFRFSSRRQDLEALQLARLWVRRRQNVEILPARFALHQDDGGFIRQISEPALRFPLPVLASSPQFSLEQFARGRVRQFVHKDECVGHLPFRELVREELAQFFRCRLCPVLRDDISYWPLLPLWV